MPTVLYFVRVKLDEKLDVLASDNFVYHMAPQCPRKLNTSHIQTPVEQITRCCHSMLSLYDPETLLKQTLHGLSMKAYGIAI